MKKLALTLMLLTGTPVLAAPVAQKMQYAPVTLMFPDSPRSQLMSATSPHGAMTAEKWECEGKGYALTAESERQVPVPASSQLFRQRASELLADHPGSQEIGYRSNGKSAEVEYRLADGSHSRAKMFLLGQELVVIEASWRNPVAAYAARNFLDTLRIEH